MVAENVVDLSRLQFALTAMYHFLFVPLTLGLVWLLQPILMPFLVGIALAYLGDPVVDQFEARGVSRTLGVLVVFVVFSAVVAAALLVLVPMLLREVASLVNNIPAFVEWLQKTTSPLLMRGASPPTSCCI